MSDRRSRIAIGHLEVALTVQRELDARVDEAHRLRQQEVERARYEADLARRRYMQVDPSNRLVADTLEAEWNAKLRALADAQERCEQKRQNEHVIDSAQRARILALATDFPRLWTDPRTPIRERKRMARLLIEDVTLLKGDELRVQVRFKGGATRVFSLPLPQPAWMLRRTPAEVITVIDQLLNEHTDGEIATLLNERGFTSGEGKRFHLTMVARIRVAHALKSRYERLRARGLLDQSQIAKRLGVTTGTIKIWRRAGLLLAHRYNDKGQYLFERPVAGAPRKYKHQDKTRGKYAAR